MSTEQSQIEVYEQNITNILDKYSLLLSAEQLKAITFLVHGVRVDKVARAVGVSLSAVNAWKTQNKDFTDALAEAKSQVALFHAQQLNTMVLLSWVVLEDILSMPYNKAEDQEKKEIARTARFIIDKAIGNHSTTTVLHNQEVESGNDNISKATADMIAKRIVELENPDEPIVDAEYSIVNMDEYLAIHPDSDYGKLNYDKHNNVFQCHICGDWVVNLKIHASESHGVTARQYLDVYRLDNFPTVEELKEEDHDELQDS